MRSLLTDDYSLKTKHLVYNETRYYYREVLDMMGKCCKKLCSMALGISLGIVSGLSMLVFAWVAAFWGIGTAMVEQWTPILPGYTATIGGGIIGFFWGLLEGFITGILIGFFYNLVCCCCCCKTCKEGNGSCDMKNGKK